MSDWLKKLRVKLACLLLGNEPFVYKVVPRWAETGFIVHVPPDSTLSFIDCDAHQCKEGWRVVQEGRGDE